MTIEDLTAEIRHWRWTRYKAANLLIGASALLLYELLGRPIYRPYIYANHINDFHIADTLGNTLGTVTTVFVAIAVFSKDRASGLFILKMATLGVVLFELLHPLLGKPTDVWDVAATLLTGALCYAVFGLISTRTIPKSPRNSTPLR